MIFLKRLLTASLAVAFLGTPSWAADRAALIQSKIQNALGQILPSTDFLVLVNRVDQLDDASQSGTISGALKPLPGLNVGVDDKGQVVRQDAQSGDYTGGVSISVILDSHVKPQTRQMIKKNLPEISGGLRDDDELKVSDSVLRQPPVPAGNPPVSINNTNTPPTNSTGETLRFLALLLMTGGIFAWILGRMSGSQTQKQQGGANASPLPAPKEEPSRGKTQRPDLSELDPRIVSLFLMKQVKDRKMEIVDAWYALTPPAAHRKVMLSQPAWVAACLQALPKAAVAEMEDEKIDVALAEKIYLDITVLEHSLKSDHDYEKAFLMWFPPQALRWVPRFQQKLFSAGSRETLWYFRPDLGDFVNVQNLNQNLNEEPASERVHTCVSEMSAWTSSAFISQDRQHADPVQIWAQIVNSLGEFGPIESQLKQAREKLTPEQFSELKKLAVDVETPLAWDETRLKSWLRAVDPQDFLWWKSLLKAPPAWDMSQSLRPLRLAMFELAEKSPVYQSWSESEKKAASTRLLTLFRMVHLDAPAADAYAEAV